MKNLKKCPFCGGEHIEIDSCNGLEACENFEECGDAGYTAIVCDVTKGGCGASSGYFRSQDDAINAWNRRTN